MRRIVESFQHAKNLWKVILAIYFFQMLLASTVGLQMTQVLDASIGNSLSLKSLVDGFDYTVFSDFVNVHGGSFSVLFGQMRWMAMIYLVFASFISAGLIYVLSRRSKDYGDFFKGGSHYFAKFFFIDIIFLVVIIVIVGVSLGTIGTLFNIAPTEFDTELTFLRWALVIVILAILLITVLTLWKVKSKFHYLNSDDGIWGSVGQGIKGFWGHKWKLLSYSILFLSLSLILLYLNHLIGSLPIILMIIIQQSFMLFKILWKVMFLDVVGDSQSV